MVYTPSPSCVEMEAAGEAAGTGNEKGQYWQRVLAPVQRQV